MVIFSLLSESGDSYEMETPNPLLHRLSPQASRLAFLNFPPTCQMNPQGLSPIPSLYTIVFYAHLWTFMYCRYPLSSVSPWSPHWVVSLSFLPVTQVVYNEHGSRGFGFVHFETHEAAQKAINTMNGMLLNDRKVWVPGPGGGERLWNQECCFCDCLVVGRPSLVCNLRRVAT